MVAMRIRQWLATAVAAPNPTATVRLLGVPNPTEYRETPWSSGVLAYVFALLRLSSMWPH